MGDKKNRLLKEPLSTAQTLAVLLGNEIRETREDLGASLDEIQKLTKAKNKISMVEKGRSKLSMKEIMKLLAIMGKAFTLVDIDPIYVGPDIPHLLNEEEKIKAEIAEIARKRERAKNKR